MCELQHPCMSKQSSTAKNIFTAPLHHSGRNVETHHRVALQNEHKRYRIYSNCKTLSKALCVFNKSSIGASTPVDIVNDTDNLLQPQLVASKLWVEARSNCNLSPYHCWPYYP